MLGGNVPVRLVFPIDRHFFTSALRRTVSCRCLSGYRPILDAAKSLGSDGGAPTGCCRGGDGSCPCFDSKVIHQRNPSMRHSDVLVGPAYSSLLVSGFRRDFFFVTSTIFSVFFLQFRFDANSFCFLCCLCRACLFQKNFVVLPLDGRTFLFFVECGQVILFFTRRFLSRGKNHFLFPHTTHRQILTVSNPKTFPMPNKHQRLQECMFSSADDASYSSSLVKSRDSVESLPCTRGMCIPGKCLSNSSSFFSCCT